MKNKFYGYYKPSKETFDALWGNALIVLDANILLDFFIGCQNQRVTICLRF